MLYRVVRMVFTEESKSTFTSIFYKKQADIAAFPGCISVELMKDERAENALATWSIWESNKDLENYRNSALFQETWDEVKPLFAEKAKAWSYTKFNTDET